MSDKNTDVTAPDEQAAPEEQEVEYALGTGAREPVDGDMAKSYVPDNVSPQATIIADPVVGASELPVEKEDEGTDDVPPMAPPSALSH